MAQISYAILYSLK